MRPVRPCLYLASQSPRRRKILRSLGIRFRQVLSRYVEHPLKGVRPREVVRRHAVEKARRAVLPAHARYVLGADTEVVYRGKVFGKPTNLRAAGRMLAALSGRTHSVYTGLALWDRQRDCVISEVCRTRVRMKKLTAGGIRDYCRRVHVLDKAGAYSIQERPRIVQSISGSHTNVVGLPAGLLRKMLATVKCA